MTQLEILENELKSRGLSNLTLKAYVRHNNNFLKFTKKKAEEVLNDDIKNYLNHLTEEKKLKSSSIILTLSALKFYYEGILKKQIFDNIKLPQTEEANKEALSKEEIKKLIDGIKNQKHKLIVGLMYGAGLKVSEVVNLNVKDINIKNKVGKAKSGSKEKSFVLASKLIEFLNEYLQNRENESEFLFPTRKSHMSIRMAQKIVNKAAKTAKIEKKVNCTLLRDTYSKHLIENGVDNKVVQILLGNYGVYKNLKLTKEQMKDIISPFDSLY